MIFRILSPGLACSSLVVGCLNAYKRLPGVPYYEKHVPSWIDTFACMWCTQRPLQSVHNMRDFSFVFASTLYNQSVANKALKELGFWNTTAQYNKKNGTKPRAWVGRKDDIDAALVRLGYNLATGKKET